jgi:hypothetical protein
LIGEGLGPRGLDQRHDIDQELLSNFIIGGITKIIQRLGNNELDGLIYAPSEVLQKNLGSVAMQSTMATWCSSSNTIRMNGIQ